MIPEGPVTQIVYQPKRSDQLILELIDQSEKNLVNLNQCGYWVQLENKWFRLNKKKYTSTLLSKLDHPIQAGDIISVRNDVQQQLLNIQDRMENSQVQTTLGLMYFQAKSYLEAAKMFLLAKALSPVSVVQLFLHDIPANFLSNNVFPDRCTQPDIQTIEKCQLFGLFKQQILALYNDDAWSQISQKLGNPVVNYQQYIGLQQSPQEQTYCVQQNTCGIT